VVWTLQLYRPSAVRFPRLPEEFRPAADREKAEAAAKAALERNAEDPAAWTELAVAQFETGPSAYLSALESLERARDLGALDDRLFYYAGVMYESVGLPDYARPEFARFLRHRPQDAETRLRLANLHYRLGDFDRAAEQYKTLLAASPDDPVVSVNLAMVHRQQSRWEEGLKLLNAFVEAGRPLPEGAHKVLGDLYRGAARPKEALPHYLSEAARRPEDPAPVEALAQAYEESGELSEAVTHWKRLLQLDPKHATARSRIRRLERALRTPPERKKRR
jgi:tetratricopeptide (TPR) repeat protein